jgi:hypothetical protein
MLAFCNSYSEDIWVAYMFWSPDTCGGEGQPVQPTRGIQGCAGSEDEG